MVRNGLLVRNALYDTVATTDLEHPHCPTAKNMNKTTPTSREPQEWEACELTRRARLLDAPCEFTGPLKAMHNKYLKSSDQGISHDRPDRPGRAYAHYNPLALVASQLTFKRRKPQYAQLLTHFLPISLIPSSPTSSPTHPWNVQHIST